MICEVCGHDMRLVRVVQDQPVVQEYWVCSSWCYALITVYDRGKGVSRVPYAPIDSRWEEAKAEVPDDLSHAYGHFGVTLCGVKCEEGRPLPYLWFSKSDKSCSECRDAAIVIDSRWPLDKRDLGEIIPPFDSSGRPLF